LLAWWRASAATAREALAGTALNKGGREAELAAALPRLDAAAAGRGHCWTGETLAGVSRTFLASGELTKRKGNLAAGRWRCSTSPMTLLAAARALWPRLLADALAIARERLAAIKERTGLLGYEDLLRLLDEGLRAPGGERLAAAIRRQYPVALIDEFQDTDPLQWSVFSAVYAGDDTALFLVGDPKQAIYAFRGADVQAYLQVRREAAGTIRSLDTNYRSVATAGRWPLNALFRAAQRRRSLPGRRRHALPGGACPRAHPTRRRSRATARRVAPLAVLHLASDTAALGHRLPRAHRGGGGEPPGRAAGLPPTAAACGWATKAPGNPATSPAWCATGRTRNASPPSSTGAASRTCTAAATASTPARRQLDLYQLLAAVLEPGSERLLRAALGSALLGRTAAELDALARRRGGLRARAGDASSAFPRNCACTACRPCCAGCCSPTKCRRACSPRRAGERALTDCLHLVELLQAERERARQRRGPARAAGRAHRRRPTASRRRSACASRATPKRVQIVTLHSHRRGWNTRWSTCRSCRSSSRRGTRFFHDPDTLAACYDLLAGTEASEGARRARAPGRGHAPALRGPHARGASVRARRR
jgi:exodeoxyribonuclease V beta subunit